VIALVCPACKAFVIANDGTRQKVPCPKCATGISVPPDVPKDSDLLRIMEKAVARYAPKADRQADTPLPEDLRSPRSKADA
jgi:hypothetical protein